MTRLHVLGLPHTLVCDEYSHCPYTGKIQRFGKMMHALGYEVHFYGIEGSHVPHAHMHTVLPHHDWHVVCKSILMKIICLWINYKY